MVTPDMTRETLGPWLGGAFLARRRDVAEACAAALQGFRPGGDALRRLASELDNLLFLAVRDDTRGRMALAMDDGRLIRLRIADFAAMADELLWLALKRLSPTEIHHALIREYSMKSGSLSALRALYLLYRGLQSPEETAAIRRVITGCHDPYRFREWIDAQP